jgi:heme-degrading monooxygenase HmoA
MFARSTTIMGDPARIDAGVAFVRDEVMPGIMKLDGCVGLSCIVDRGAGRLIATSSWATEEAMRASDSQVAGLRERGMDIMQGTLAVEEWEVAVMHREHQSADGACCRVTWLRTRPEDIDRGIEIYRSQVLPMVEEMDGFCSASLLVDRAGGRACGTSTWDTRAAMEASRLKASALRDETAASGGGEIIEVAEFDLVMAHLRVPELV